MAETAADYERPEDMEQDPAGVVRRWVSELALAKKRDDEWLGEAKTIFARYEMEKGARTAHGFNILWANTEVMSPSIYNSTPKPDVRRRYRDKDLLGKAVSEVMQRALEYSLDEEEDGEGFDDAMKDVVLDLLLPGRGLARVRYKVETYGGEEDSQIADQCTATEHVQYDDFRHGPGKRWKQVKWIAFRHRLTRRALVNKFSDAGREVALDDPEGLDDVRQEEREQFQTGEVWEIWDKVERKVLFIAGSYKKGPLKEIADPLKLKGFFPMPRPVYAVHTTRSLKPVPFYRQYEEQAKELDSITVRINKVVKALRVRGFYNTSVAELGRLFDGEDGELIPAENMSQVTNAGGFDNLIWMLPIEKLAQVLTYLYEAREQTKQTIYEIMGIADVLRGATDPKETLGAQHLKSQWGSQRMQRLQREVQRYARDLIRLQAELVANHFEVETLQAMTDLKYPMGAEKQAAQMQMQLLAHQGQQQEPPPELQDMLSQPSWEEIMGLMRSDQMRQYRIDVETDSTVAEQVANDMEGMRETVGAILEWFEGAAQAVQMGYMPMQSAKDIGLAIARRGRLGTVVEDAIEEMEEPAEDPARAAQMAQAQADAAKAEADKQRAEVDQQKLAIDGQRVQLDGLKLQLEDGKLRLEAQRQDHELRREAALFQAELENLYADLGVKRATMAKTMEEARAQDIENDATESGLIQMVERIGQAEPPEDSDSAGEQES